MNRNVKVTNTLTTMNITLYEQAAVALLQRGQREELGSNEWQREIKYLSVAAVEG